MASLTLCLDGMADYGCCTCCLSLLSGSLGGIASLLQCDRVYKNRIGLAKSMHSSALCFAYQCFVPQRIFEILGLLVLSLCVLTNIYWYFAQEIAAVKKQEQEAMAIAL